MKKIKFLLITSVSMALLTLVGLKADNGEVNFLFGIENANAECTSTPINNGRCSWAGNCYVDAANPAPTCDSTKTGGPTTPPPGGGGGGN